MVNPTTSPLIFSKLLYNIYLPLPIFLPPTNKNHLVIFLNPSPPELPFLRSLPYISLRKHRGSAHRARGLEYKQKQQSPIPPLSGGEVARKTEGKGRGLFERSEFRRPRRRPRRRAQKPDNCGGAFFDRERKSFVSPLPSLTSRKKQPHSENTSV